MSLPTTQTITTPPPSAIGQGWAGAHIDLQFHQYADEMRNWILLDNQSSVAVFCNKSMVTNIRDSSKGDMELAINGGTLTTKMKTTLPGCGEVWFHDGAITNIFSYAEMSDKYRITYNSQKDNAFVVHFPDRQVRFERLGNSLYVFKPPIKKT